MYKLSKGDLAVNRSAYSNNFAGLSKEDLRKKRKKFFSVNETVVPDENIKNVIPIQYNSNGSLKYTFDNIYENKQLTSIAKDYYSNRDSEVYNDKQAVDKFISDRTWNQANTFAMGKEFLYVTGDNITNDQKARLSYLTRYWDELPNFYEEGGRGASGFFANLGVGVLDPLNVVGAGVGGLVSKTVLKKAGQEVIKSQVKKGVTKKTLAKEILNSP